MKRGQQPSASLGVHGLTQLWNRELDNYPGTTRRVFFILTVLCTATLYYGRSVHRLVLPCFWSDAHELPFLFGRSPA